MSVSGRFCSVRQLTQWFFAPAARPQMQNTETGVVYELPVNGDPILEVSLTFFGAVLTLQPQRG